MQARSVSASVSVYSNDYTQWGGGGGGGQETVKIGFTLSLHIDYLLWRLTSADFFTIGIYL